MKRYEICIDLPSTVKEPRKYLEKKIPNCNVVFCSEAQAVEGTDKHIKKLENLPKKNVCDICGKEYETYPIILDANPLSIASFLEDESRDDGSMRTICKSCREDA